MKKKTVSYKDVSKIAMTTGKEKEISKVIHNKTLCEWVGIGWVDLRPATKEDYKKYPTVK